MAKFEIANKRTSVFEGFYANDKADTGGETLWGISRLKGAAFPEFWKLVDEFKKLPDFPNNMKNSEYLKRLKNSWYKKNYWDVLRLDEINNQDIANNLYDISVNKGSGTARKWMIEISGCPGNKITDNIIKYYNNEKSRIDFNACR